MKSIFLSPYNPKSTEKRIYNLWEESGFFNPDKNPQQNTETKKLYEEILEFTLNSSTNIKSQIKKMGASCDWSREKFTLDPDIVQTVYTTFKKLSDDNIVYRGKKIVSWCSKHQTSFSDLEIK